MPSTGLPFFLVHEPLYIFAITQGRTWTEAISGLGGCVSKHTKAPTPEFSQSGTCLAPSLLSASVYSLTADSGPRY